MDTLYRVNVQSKTIVYCSLCLATLLTHLALLLWVNAKPIHVSVHQHTVVALDKLALSGRLPQRYPHALVRVLVVVAHHLLDGLGGFTGIVKGNSRAVVVQHVGLDDVVENVLSNKTKFSVDGGSSAPGEVPLVGFVVGHLGVRVLKKRNEHQPVVHVDVRNGPVHEHVERTKVLVPCVDNKRLGQDTNVTHDNVPVVPLLKNGRVGVEVVHAPSRVSDLLAGDVGEEVHDPAAQLLAKQVAQRVKRRVAGDLFQGVGVVLLHERLFSVGHEHHVSVHVARGLVVLAVGKLPGEVRHKPVRVQDPAHGVIDPGVVRKRPMATFVGQHPKTGTKKTLDIRVSGPRSKTKRWVRQQADVVLGHVPEKHHASNVSEHVPERFGGSSLVAVGRNGSKNILDGVVGGLEGVAISVDGGGLGGKRRHVAILLDGGGGARVEARA